MCLTLIWKEKMCLIYKFKVMERKIMVIVLLMALLFPCVVHAQGLNLSNGTEYMAKVKESAGEYFNVFLAKPCKIHVGSDGSFVGSNKGPSTDARFFAVDYQIDESENYVIEASVEKVSESTKYVSQCGLMFGWKNWDNYNLLQINQRGQFCFEARRNGIYVFNSKWMNGIGPVRPHRSIKIKIVKQSGKILFALNGNIVLAVDAFDLGGESHGLTVAGTGTYAIHNLKIQETDEAVLQIPTQSSNENSESVQGNATENSNEMQIVGSGTGFLIDKNGYLATNHHVIDGAGAIGVCLRIDGEWQSFDGVVIKDDPTNDLAIIKIEDPKFKAFDHLPYAFSFETADVASEIFTLGYPQVQIMGSDVKYTTGVVNARTGIQGDPTHYQISAHIDHGNSGGPLFDEKGFIIGITDSGLDKATFGDVNYAIKSTYLKVLADALPKKLEFANDRSIAQKKRTEQIKTLSQYVALILIAK